MVSVTTVRVPHEYHHALLDPPPPQLVAHGLLDTEEVAAGVLLALPTPLFQPGVTLTEWVGVAVSVGVQGHGTAPGSTPSAGV